MRPRALFFGITLSIPLWVVIFLAVSAATAQTIDITFATDPNVGISGPPGSLEHVGHASVPAAVQGVECLVTVDVHNNDSVRAGTDLLVSSGGVNLELANVEAVKGDAPPKSIGTLTLGESVNVWVRFGPQGEASVDATIHVGCPDTPPPPPDEPVCMIPEGCDTPPSTPPGDPKSPFFYGPGVPEPVVAQPRTAG